ncbi:MAG: transcriptional repressor LexA [Treponema sp.]|jgi:repressor LexA|nr:transcriptional repressor LexA [Treponema sp.]
MKELTQRQQEVLDFITKYVKIHTYPPTIREVASYFKVSVKGAYDHVTALKKKGCLRGGELSRTLEVVKTSQDETAEIIEIPILGNVAAGQPIITEENWDGTVYLHPSMLKKNRNYFAVKVKGDSMTNAGILDGDTAVIEQQDTAQNGEIIIAMVNEAMTLKRYFRENTRIRLQPENDAYQPIYSRDIRVLGRLVHVVRSY